MWAHKLVSINRNLQIDPYVSNVRVSLYLLGCRALGWYHVTGGETFGHMFLPLTGAKTKGTRNCLLLHLGGKGEGDWRAWVDLFMLSMVRVRA